MTKRTSIIVTKEDSLKFINGWVLTNDCPNESLENETDTIPDGSSGYDNTSGEVIVCFVDTTTNGYLQYAIGCTDYVGDGDYTWFFRSRHNHLAKLKVLAFKYFDEFVK